jgi:DNA-binding transcriptional regulator YdaS (Cro superfamily)
VSTASLTLSDWLARATPAQREELARLCSSSAADIYQLATGRRNVSAEKAADIEAATQTMKQLPPVLRTSSCKACASCPFAARCADVPVQGV